jgi:hypothetical protein
VYLQMLDRDFSVVGANHEEFADEPGTLALCSGYGHMIKLVLQYGRFK